MQRSDATTHTPELFEEFWKVYPKLRDRDGTANLFSKIVEAGVDPRWIVQAADKFKSKSAGSARMYLPYADNWLKNNRWKDFPQTATTDHSSRNPVEEQALFWARQIKTATYIAPNAIKEEALNFIIKNDLASPGDLRRLELVR